MDKTEVAVVERVIDVLEVIALAFIEIDLEHAVEVCEFGVKRKLRRLALAQKSEHEAKILPHRISLDANLVGKTRLLSRLFNATTVAVVLSAMIEAANRTGMARLHKANRKLNLRGKI